MLFNHKPCLTLCDPAYWQHDKPPHLSPSTSLPKLVSSESVMLSNHLILCHPLLLLLLIFPNCKGRHVPWRWLIGTSHLQLTTVIVPGIGKLSQSDFCPGVSYLDVGRDALCFSGVAELKRHSPVVCMALPACPHSPCQVGESVVKRAVGESEATT